MFRKQYKKIEQYCESWTVYITPNKELVIRLNEGLREAAGHIDYPIKVGIAAPVRPEADLISMKIALEDEIESIWKKNKKGVLLAVITGTNAPNFVEVLSYANEDTDFASLHEELKSRFSAEDIQMYAEQDRNWDTYLELLS
jgi:hypothetical protein